jgi:hypothetical protein
MARMGEVDLVAKWHHRSWSTLPVKIFLWPNRGYGGLSNYHLGGGVPMDQTLMNRD